MKAAQTHPEAIHYPRLDTVWMVEDTIKERKEFPSKRQLWQSLPKQMMYQTFSLIIDYLEESGKIMYDKDGTIIWIHDSEGIKKILATGVKIR